MVPFSKGDDEYEINQKQLSGGISPWKSFSNIMP